MSTPRIAHLLSQELIDALQVAFPNLRPQARDTERIIFLRSGQQQVIEFLQQQFDERVAQAMEIA